MRPGLRTKFAIIIALYTGGFAQANELLSPGVSASQTYQCNKLQDSMQLLQCMCAEYSESSTRDVTQGSAGLSQLCGSIAASAPIDNLPPKRITSPSESNQGRSRPVIVADVPDTQNSSGQAHHVDEVTSIDSSPDSPEDTELSDSNGTEADNWPADNASSASPDLVPDVQ